METWYFVWAFTAAAGLVSAGLAGSLWAVFAGERPQVEILRRLDGRTPFKVAAVAAYAPMAVTRAGFDYLEHNPLLGFMAVALGLVWSFMQGVFILTTFFGYS
jgi:hypothetical protein